jgi:hypothetical protein
MSLKIYVIGFMSITCLSTSVSCSRAVEKEPVLMDGSLFTLLQPDQTGVNFENKIVESQYNNLISNFYVYNGGGVATGDVNNDGLEDIYFVSNQNQDHLYLNQGEFQFVEVSEKAGIKNDNGWTTGVTMVDINNDGWLDIFVSKSSPVPSREMLANRVYLNQKDGTFKESSMELGLLHYGFSVQHYFLDYDQDGDLDIYVIDHQMRNLVFSEDASQEIKDSFVGQSNQLFRNDGGKFTNVTSTSFDDIGIHPTLSAAIGDFNQDSWPDIYVCNDFLLPDQLYINNQDGTFTNRIHSLLNHTASNSMGSDFADINNDLLPDLFVLDMLAADHIRSKENMTSMNSALFDSLVQIGYHKQYMTNVLQLNSREGGFQEIGQLSNVNKTDWSWGALLADFNNDGLRDIFVGNGIHRDIDNRDFRNNYQKILNQNLKISLDEFHSLIPSAKQQNFIFKNQGDLTFKNEAVAWGLPEKINSNGATYSDLDNDGDLDLILNNLNDKASIYRNNSNANFIQVELVGSAKNRSAIGAEVRVFANDLKLSSNQYPSRGFQSGVSQTLTLGIGQNTTIDSLVVFWDKSQKSTLRNLASNQRLTIEFKSSREEYASKEDKYNPLFEEIQADLIGLNVRHTESVFNDFDHQLLLPQKQSVNGAIVAVSDVNGDGLDDVFFGNAAGHPASIFIQTESQKFEKRNAPLFEKDRNYEDMDALFLDIDNDGDQDLYVASGSYEFKEDSNLLHDRLYLNDGKGNFARNTESLPGLKINSAVVRTCDIDQDGDQDLFIGAREIPGQYPKSSSSYFLENTGGQFVENTSKYIEELSLGMINDALFSDYDGDGDYDLLVVGEWMPVVLLENNDGFFERSNMISPVSKSGWYRSIAEMDLDNDGKKDYVIGNFGRNNKFKPSENSPLHVFASDYDQNGSYDIALSKKYKGDLVPVRGRDCSSEQNSFILDRMTTFKDFANASLPEIYGEQNIANALHLTTETFDSCLLEQKADGTWTLEALPNLAQLSPTLDITAFDIDNDGDQDIVGVGNFYQTEVETVSYDAGRCYVLIKEGNSTFKPYSGSGLFVNKNSRKAEWIRVGQDLCLIVTNNDNTPSIFKLIR